MSEPGSDHVDMSEEAIEQRLRRLSQLSRLCQELKEAGRQAGLGNQDQPPQAKNASEP